MAKMILTDILETYFDESELDFEEQIWQLKEIISWGYLENQVKEALAIIQSKAEEYGYCNECGSDRFHDIAPQRSADEYIPVICKACGKEQ